MKVYKVTGSSPSERVHRYLVAESAEAAIAGFRRHHQYVELTGVAIVLESVFLAFTP